MTKFVLDKEMVFTYPENPASPHFKLHKQYPITRLIEAEITKRGGGRKARYIGTAGEELLFKTASTDPAWKKPVSFDFTPPDIVKVPAHTALEDYNPDGLRLPNPIKVTVFPPGFHI